MTGQSRRSRLVSPREAAHAGGRSTTLVFVGIVAGITALVAWLLASGVTAGSGSSRSGGGVTAAVDDTLLPQPGGLRSGRTHVDDQVSGRHDAALAHAGRAQPARVASLARSDGASGEAAPVLARTDRGEQATTRGGKVPGTATDGDGAEKTDDEVRRLPISGWVLDDSGAPVPGIAVVASGRRLFHHRGGDPGDPYETTGASGSTTTDAAGAFALTGLAEGEYLVSTRASPAHEPARALLRAGTNDAVLVVEDNARDRVLIEGFVTDAASRPLPGVRVRVPGARGTARSGPDGHYALGLSIGGRNRSYSVRFVKRGYAAASIPLGGAVLVDGGEVALDAVLRATEATAPVAGSVVDTDGRPVSAAAVRLFSPGLQRGYSASTDGAGTFLLPEVEVAHDYQLTVRPRSLHREHREQNVTVASTGAHLAVTLEPLGLGTLTGQMVDANGTPVPELSLWLEADSASSQRYRLVTGDRAGWFSVTDLPEGEVRLMTRASPDLAVTGLYVYPGISNSTRLPVDHGNHSVAGFVFDRLGRPVAGARVSLSWSFTDGALRSRSRRASVTDDSGYFLFTQVGPGQHTVAVDATGYRATRIDHRVDTLGGGADLVVRLQEEHS